ncbi:hypothetical protein SAMN06298216_0482 [Spirosomataceae bacterium TFI 002]|nr:hypothetical protein SAMN06298216_0482 [Spirosomataceae bacterium TFI 002]
MLKKISFYFSFLLLVAVSIKSNAQGQGNTPYSIFGIGELADPTDAPQEMMGGAGSSFTNSFYINLVNPALLVKNRTVGDLKYVAWSVGLRGNYRNIVKGDEANSGFGYNLQNLTLAFPLKRNWAMAVALRPYSMVDYRIKTTSPISGNSSEEFNVINTYNGGISRVSYVNSISLFNNLYLGIEGSYNFGTIQKDSISYLSSNQNQLTNSFDYTLTGASVKFGAAYQHSLNKKWKLNVGGSAELQGKLKTEELKTFAIYQDGGVGPELQTKPDTISLNNFSANTPAQFKVGLSLESPYHWVFAADYGITKWNGIKHIDNLAGNFMQDSRDLSFGIEYLPNSSSTKYLNQVFYRVGYKMSTTPYNIDGTSVKDNRISLGMSLPMGFRNPSYMNLGVAFGRRGLNSGSLVEENYIRISTSFSLLSPWFIKPKID